MRFEINKSYVETNNGELINLDQFLVKKDVIKLIDIFSDYMWAMAETMEDGLSYSGVEYLSRQLQKLKEELSRE